MIAHLLIAVLAAGPGLGLNIGLTKGGGRIKTFDPSTSHATFTGCSVKVLKGTAPSVTRTGTEGDMCAGQWYSSASNTAALNDDGAGIWGVRTNYELQASSLVTGTAWTAPWQSFVHTPQVPATTMAANYVAAPDGTTTADRVVIGAPTDNTDYSLVSQLIAMAAVPYTQSCWIKANSGTPKIYVWFTTGAAPTAEGSCLPTTSGYTRCSNTQTLGVSSYYGNYGYDRRGTTNQPGATGGDVDFWGCQVEKSLHPTPVIDTAGTAVATNPTTVTVAAPATTSFMVSVTMLPRVTDWNGVFALWQYGTAGAANSADAWVNSGTLTIDVRDAANGVKTWTVAGLAGSTAKAVVITINAGAVTASVAGVAQTLSASGAGTGIIGAAQTTVTLGFAHPSASDIYLNGRLASECVGPVGSCS